MTIPLKCILLVEDSPRDIELTLDALAQHNLANEVVAVRDGAEALDYLHRRGPFATRPAGNPAVVLLDLKMPDIDGMEVLKIIRKVSSTPVIIITGHPQDVSDIHLADLKIEGYIEKPISLAAVINTLKYLIGE